MSKILYRVGKIAISSKLPDRFLSVKTFSPDEKDKEKDSLYFLIEILSPWFPATEIGKKIEDTMIKNYYAGTTFKSSEEKFEEAVKKTNLVLAELAKNGDTSWVGKLNVILAAISKNQINITNCGTADAFLLRKQTFQKICQDDKTPRPPIHTFSNLVAGSLEEEDKILFANSELSTYLPKENLQGILENFDPITGIHEIAKYLREKNIKTINCLSFEVISQDKAMFQPPAELSDIVYLDQKEDAWLEKTIKKTKPVTAGFGSKIKSSLAKGREKAGPVFRKITIGMGKGVIKTGRFTRDKIGILTKNRREKARDRIRSGKIKDWEEFAEIPKQQSNASTIWQYLKAFFLWLYRMIILLFTKQRKVLIVIILAIILILGINVIRQKIAKPKINVTQLIQTAEAKEKDAKSELSLNNKDKARILFSEALNTLKPAVEDDRYKDKVISLYNQIQGEEDQMDNIKRFEQSSPVFNFTSLESSTEIVEIIFLENDVYAADKLSNKIYQISKTDFQIKNTAQIPLADGQITTGTRFQNSLLWLTDSSNLYLQNTANNSVSKQNLSLSNLEPIQISNYSNNIYSLSPTKNQIYKFISSGSSWADPKEVIKGSEVDISKAVSFTIDGDFYILNSDGTGVKISMAKIMPDFTLKNIPPPNEKITNALKILTNAEANSLFILAPDQKAIFEFDKSGNYIQQYILPNDINDIKDLTINFTTKLVYVLADSYLYQFSF